MTEETQRLRLREADVHWHEIDGEVIALEARTSLYLAANGTGSLLWQALVGGSTRARLADVLTDRFGIGRDQARADVERFLDDLAAHGLLESAEHGSQPDRSPRAAG